MQVRLDQITCEVTEHSRSRHSTTFPGSESGLSRPLAILTTGVGQYGREPWLAEFYDFHDVYNPAHQVNMVVLDYPRYEAYADFQVARDEMLNHYNLLDTNGVWIEARRITDTAPVGYLRQWSLHLPNPYAVN